MTRLRYRFSNFIITEWQKAVNFSGEHIIKVHLIKMGFHMFRRHSFFENNIRTYGS